MTEGRGLSIFEDEPEDSGESQRQETAADDPTVVIPVGARNTPQGAPAAAGDTSSGQRRDATRTQAIPVAKADEADRVPRQAGRDGAPRRHRRGHSTAPPQPPEPPARVIPATATPARQSTAGRASSPVAPGSAFPVVRRGGYDKDAVDRRLLQFAGEKDGLSASLDRAREQIAQLEKKVEELSHQAKESDTPSYAGLGGRASELLRLAEEQADEVLTEANAQATQVRQQAQRDAAAIKAAADRDAEDMRVVQLTELEETRKRVTADIESERARALAEADDVRASAKREADQLRLGAEQEVQALRTSAAREAEQSKAVDRPRGPGGPTGPGRGEGAADPRGRRAPQHGHR